MEKIGKNQKPRIGVYTMGLRAYWKQFAGLQERLTAYGRFIADRLQEMGAEVFFYGLVDCEEEGHRCGEYMKILCESGIVESRQEGKWTHYRLSESGCRKAEDLLRKLTESAPEEKCSCCP